MDNGISFRETVANWTGQVYQALKEIDKWHDRIGRKLRDMVKTNDKRFQELDDKIDGVKDELKDLIRSETQTLLSTIREDVRREKEEIHRVYTEERKEQKIEVAFMKKKLGSIYIKVVALGTSVGLFVGILIKLLLDKVT